MGVLTEDDRVELLEGWIVQRMIHNPRHDATIDKAHDAIRDRLPAGWRIRVQSAVRTADSEPEPDLAIVRGPAERYSGMHPRAEDLGFIVEVADTSLTRDREWKGRLYAAAHFRVYWIINLVDNQVEAYTNPGDAAGEPGFAMRKDYKIGENVPLVFEGEEVGQIPVEDLLVL
jgi:Uma2 family endonuclease